MKVIKTDDHGVDHGSARFLRIALKGKNPAESLSDERMLEFYFILFVPAEDRHNPSLNFFTTLTLSTRVLPCRKHRTPWT